MLRMAFRLGPGSFHPEARVCLSWVCRPVGALGQRGQEAGAPDRPSRRARTSTGTTPPASVPDMTRMCLNASCVFTLDSPPLLLLPRKLLLSSREFVQLVTRTPLKPSPSEIRQRTRLKLRPRDLPFESTGGTREATADRGWLPTRFLQEAGYETRQERPLA